MVVLAVGMGGVGFASFSGNGGFDECGCDWVCD